MQYNAISVSAEKVMAPITDNGHPERAFFQKFESFGLGQTNWAEILGSNFKSKTYNSQILPK